MKDFLEEKECKRKEIAYDQLEITDRITLVAGQISINKYVVFTI